MLSSDKENLARETMKNNSFAFIIGTILWFIVAVTFLFGGVNCHTPQTSVALNVLNSACETLGKEASFGLAICLSIICLVMAIRGANET